MRWGGAFLALLGGGLCAVAWLVPFDTGYPPIGDPAIVPVAFFAAHVVGILWVIPILLGMLLLLGAGIRAWWSRRPLPGWVAVTSFVSLGWVVLSLVVDGYARMLGESTTGPALGFWMMAAGFLLGSTGPLVSYAQRRWHARANHKQRNQNYGEQGSKAT